MGAGNQCCSASADGKGPCSSGSDVMDAATGEITDRSRADAIIGRDIQGIEVRKVDIQAKNRSDVFDGAIAASGVPGPDSAAGGDVGNSAGHQTMSYDDGSTYTGHIVDGKRTGHGSWQSRTGQYDGQWKADAQHGHGRQTWSDGRVFDGQFEFGRFSGHGKMVWHTQKGLMVYDGEYREDLKHGHGMFTWADGRSYDGEWLTGKRHGRGTYVNAQLEKKTGYWLEDKFERWEEDDNIPPLTV